MHDLEKTDHPNKKNENFVINVRKAKHFIVLTILLRTFAENYSRVISEQSVSCINAAPYVLHFQVLHLQVLHFQRPRYMDDNNKSPTDNNLYRNTRTTRRCYKTTLSAASRV